MPLPDNLWDLLKGAFVSTDSTQNDGAPALRVRLVGQQQFPDGTAAAPSITFINDTDTGIYRRGADQLGFTAGGAVQVYVDTGGLKFEGDGALTIGGSAGNRASTLHLTTSVTIGGNQIISSRGAPVADAAGGATVDAEARTAINALLARVRAHGLIAT